MFLVVWFRVLILVTDRLGYEVRCAEGHHVAHKAEFDLPCPQVAIALTLLALSLLLLWDENYGYDQGSSRSASEEIVGRDAPDADRSDSLRTRASARKRGTATAAAATAAKTNGGGKGNGFQDVRNGNEKARPMSEGANVSPNGVLKEGQGVDKDGRDRSEAGGKDGDGVGLRESMMVAWRCIASDQRVLTLGLVQSFFEGGTYTFGEAAVYAYVVVKCG